MINILKILSIPLSSLSNALCIWWIIGWYGPLIHPAATLSFYQCLGGMMILSTFFLFYVTKINSDQTPDFDRIIERLMLPYIIAGLHGFVYITCVFPFN